MENPHPDPLPEYREREVEIASGGGTRMKYAMVVLLLLVASAQAAPPKFELVEGDRVVFIGNTFVERDIQNNYLETLLTASYPNRNITFRNLGWSGDTVF